MSAAGRRDKISWRIHEIAVSTAVGTAADGNRLADAVDETGGGRSGRRGSRLSEYIVSRKFWSQVGIADSGLDR